MAPAPGMPIAPRRGNPRRRSPAMVSLGVVLVVLGALGGWRFVGAAASGTHAYLAVFTAVPMGAQVTEDDLQVVHITPAAGLLPIDAADIDQVVGTYAMVNLYPGSLLTVDQLTHTKSPGVDDALLGLQLQENQRPGRALTPGDQVILVETPDPSGSASAPTATTVLATWPASVIESEDVESDGSQVIDVLLARSSLAIVAALADQNSIALVLVAGG